MYKKILVPLDGSKLAEQALPHVAQFAKAFDASVLLINVCEPEETEQGKACRLYLHNQVDSLKTMAASKVKTEVIVGRPHEKILDCARDEGVDIIFMTSHGRSGVMPWSFGSTVNRVLHKVGVPLIIVRVATAPTSPGERSLFSRILVPLDGSERSARVLPHVVEITRKFDSEVTLFHTVEPGRHVHAIGGITYI